MEFLAVLLSGLIAIISPINFGGEAIATQQLKKQFVTVENLTVRIDNTPSYKIAQGKIDQVRIAGKGLFPMRDLRIDTLEIETDPIALAGLKAKLAKPLQAGVKLVLTEQDLNQALQSPTIVNQLKQLGGQALGSQASEQIARYTFVNPRLALLSAQRIRVEVDLQERGYQDRLKLKIETDVTVQSGKSIQLTNTNITTNEQPIYAPLTRRLIAGVNQQLNLDRLEKSGITARILSLNFSQNQAHITTFVQVRPDAQLQLKRIGKPAKN
ncbi:DUF2993 domain-containing protein [filamentous cyanobacterium LEGE 11480]|uniref:DUF2993 domain-containing protein n=1 Tax=Romeriopsis navalis LEGE 11480 TaxID=2777977 RepID=A0A928Z5K8_9CYAN|nr:DUF2993 domain-containing protein [Romeriopsis navalis]MBE9032929.1 DUF2993 domain-containing protein [Romeriopsis navalis LEGE 11480]